MTKSRRRLQLTIGLAIIGIACVLSYYSIEEKTNPIYDVYLVIDVSGSMLDEEKLDNAKNAASIFIDSIASNKNQIGLVTFQTEAKLLLKTTSDSTNLKSLVQSLQAGGDTAMGDAIKIATDALTLEGRSQVNKIILLLTDGVVTTGIDPIESAKIANQNDITIFTVGYGSDADANTLDAIATITGGQYFHAQSGQDLVDVFNRISKILISPLAHYGSRTLILIAIPILLFLPTLEKGMRTVIEKAEQTFLDKRGPTKSTCPKCGYKNTQNAKFCAKCGVRQWVRNDKQIRRILT